MNFADILDDFARPRPAAGDEVYSRNGASPAFWSVLDSIAAAAPVSETAARQAYRPDMARSARQAAADETRASDLSIDPDDIAYELDLEAIASPEELSLIRRRFARLNHPDRVEAHLRDRANARMTIANAMIDTAARRFAA